MKTHPTRQINFDILNYFEDYPPKCMWYYKLRVLTKDKTFLEKLNQDDKAYVSIHWDSINTSPYGTCGKLYQKDLDIWLKKKFDLNKILIKNKVLETIINCVINTIFYIGDDNYRNYDVEDIDLKIQFYHFLLNKMDKNFDSDIKDLQIFLKAGNIYNCKKILKLLNIPIPNAI